MRDYGTAIQRFWDKVIIPAEPDACWGWVGGLTDSGYAKVRGSKTGTNRYLAHRLSWAIHHGGEMPAPEVFVCHSCDNPVCTNPRHLWLGGAGANSDDMIAKGRAHHPAGTRHYKAKLTDELVRAARAEFRGGRATIKSLAAAYGVSFSALQAAVAGKTWAHVQD